MKKYRISKYNPLLRDENGYYLIEEWSSYNDIGKIFNNKVFTKNDYLLCENKYFHAISLILSYYNVEEFIIDNLEVYFSKSKMKTLLQSKGLDFTKEDETIIDSLYEGKILKVTDLHNYLKLVLRDCFWCKFKCKKYSIHFEIGQDFYIYICCNLINKDIINKCMDIGIYIENI